MENSFLKFISGFMVILNIIEVIYMLLGVSKCAIFTIFIRTLFIFEHPYYFVI